MIVSHKYKFIFIKSKKTAGTSMEIALSRFCGDRDIITPIIPETVQELAEMGFKGEQNFNLTLRQYNLRDWRRRIKGKKPAFRSHQSAEFIKRVLGDRIWNSYFKISIERNPYDKAISRYYWSTRDMDPKPTLDDHLDARAPHSLSNWHLYTIDEKPAMDYLMRYESMDEGLEYVQKILQLPSALQLPKAKSGHRSNRQHYGQVLSTHARKRIELVCAKELAAFSYAWEEG